MIHGIESAKMQWGSHNKSKNSGSQKEGALFPGTDDFNASPVKVIDE